VLRKRIVSALMQPKVAARAGLLAVGAGVAANALYLQAGPHPAPLFGSPGAELAVTRPNELVRAVQSGLAEAGYYDGAVDGVVGPETAAAIITFERLTGRALTGMVTRDLVTAIEAEIGGEHAMGDADPDAIAALVTSADSRIAAVQDALSRAGYGQLHADGVIGPRTTEAIRRFQADHDLAVTGAVTDSLVVELRVLGMLAEE
jgi:peptidoglycan hydrolase-like protein with peptidoglycan-binding domain